MASPSWYINRLKSMSVPEIMWRISSMFRDNLDRYRVAYGIYPDENNIRPYNSIRKFNPGFSACKALKSDWSENSNLEPFAQWRNMLIQRADKICKHQLSYFNLIDVDHGDPINWLKDHGSGKSSPLKFSQSIDYRDFNSVGDCKLVWEQNRHHHLVILARAYVATSDERYAQEVVDQIISWIEQNPFGKGMNWRSPLEIGVRLINWIWAFDLIRESEAVSQEFFTSFAYQVYLHCWVNVRKYSRGSSANNHLIGEAAGVYIATAYFPEYQMSQLWRKEAKEILEREIIAQSFSDGCTREHAFGYQVFVIQFFLYCGLAGKEIGDNFSQAYWERLEKMLGFLGLLLEAGPIPMVGDADDGYVLDMSESGRDLKALFALGSVLFGRADFKLWSEGKTESVFWLLAKNGYEKYIKIDGIYKPKDLAPHNFEESGYLLMQSGKYNDSRSISVFFDQAELGYGLLAAHGHADALSFTLRIGGKEILVDPGTYDYFTYPDMRTYFRSTAAHNTIVINGADQSDMLGPFLWGRSARCKVVSSILSSNVQSSVAEHDGYFTHGVIHRRRIELNETTRSIEITDDLLSNNNYLAEIYFHFSEDCHLNCMDGSHYEVINGDVCIQLESDLRLESVLSESDNRSLGMVSRLYHEKVWAPMLKGSIRHEGNLCIKTIFTITN